MTCKKEDVSRVQSQVRRDCDVLFSGTQAGACKTSAEIFESRLLKASGEKTMAGKKKLGYFQTCKPACPEGFEKVPVRKPGTLSAKDKGICVCRLGPQHRKKRRGQDDLPEAEWKSRKPFGTEKKPVHLRRCLEVDWRGRCVDTGEAGLVSRNITNKKRT